MLGTPFKASLWNAPGVRVSLPSPPCSSWPLLSVPSGTPIRLLSPVHTLPFLPGPVPGPLPGGLAPSRRLGLSPYKPTLGPEWSLGVSPLWPFMETPCILGPQHRPGRHTVPRTTQTPSGRSSHLSCGAESGKIKRSQQQACALPGGLFPKFPGDAPTPLRLAWRACLGAPTLRGPGLFKLGVCKGQHGLGGLRNTIVRGCHQVGI